MLDMRAFEAHAGRVTARLQAKLSALAEQGKAMQRQPSCEEGDVRRLVAELRKAQDEAVAEMVAFLKPLRRRCHHPAQLLALTQIEDKMRTALKEAARQHLGDVVSLEAQLENAAAAEDEFAALVAEALAG